MTQTLTLSPSTARLDLEPWFAGASIVITGTVPSTPDMRLWAMQLWASQWELLQDATATPIATAIGSVAEGVLTVGFTPSQTSISTLSPVVGNNSFWLVIGGQDSSGNQQIIRAGNIEINPCPWTATGLSNSVGITVADDVATFIYNGATYCFPVAEIALPPVTPDGIAVNDDTAYMDFNGEVFGAPVAEVTPVPAEAIEGELVVVDDNLIVLLSGTAYTIPVKEL